MPRTLLTKRYLPAWTRPACVRVSEVIENFVARRLDAVVAATPIIGDRFRRVNPSTSVVNNFPILDEIMPETIAPWEERENSVVYVGSITPERGARELVQAISQCSEAQVRLKLAGVFNKKEFRGELESVEGWERVDWLGYLNRPSIRELLVAQRSAS